MRSVTYSPTSTISPAMSLPRMCGRFTPGSPLRTKMSRWFRAQARTRMTNLVLAQLRVGDVFVGENFGSTELMNADGFHGAPESCRAMRTVLGLKTKLKCTKNDVMQGTAQKASASYSSTWQAVSGGCCSGYWTRLAKPVSGASATAVRLRRPPLPTHQCNLDNRIPGESRLECLAGRVMLVPTGETPVAPD